MPSFSEGKTLVNLARALGTDLQPRGFSSDPLDFLDLGGLEAQGLLPTRVGRVEALSRQAVRRIDERVNRLVAGVALVPPMERGPQARLFGGRGGVGVRRIHLFLYPPGIGDFKPCRIVTRTLRCPLNIVI